MRISHRKPVAGPPPGPSTGLPALPAGAERSGLLTRDELVQWGLEVGKSLAAPALLALTGELGAGKTTLVQAICRGVGIREDVTSPTFSLVNQYEVGGTTVYHLDLYRVDGPRDLTNLGWDEIINSAAVVLVEWAERAEGRLPRDTISISLEHVPGDSDHRRIVLG